MDTHRKNCFSKAQFDYCVEFIILADSVGVVSFGNVFYTLFVCYFIRELHVATFTLIQILFCD
jgi:hypothetical protein